jgi:hypothetical protein
LAAARSRPTLVVAVVDVMTVTMMMTKKKRGMEARRE